MSNSNLPRITLRLSEEQNAKLRYIADINTRKLNDEIKRIVQKHIDEYEANNGKLLYTEDGEVIPTEKFKEEKSLSSKIG